MVRRVRYTCSAGAVRNSHETLRARLMCQVIPVLHGICDMELNSARGAGNVPGFSSVGFTGLCRTEQMNWASLTNLLVKGISRFCCWSSWLCLLLECYFCAWKRQCAFSYSGCRRSMMLYSLYGKMLYGVLSSDDFPTLHQHLASADLKNGMSEENGCSSPCMAANPKSTRSNLHCLIQCCFT